jgi:hypothetical protein
MVREAMESLLGFSIRVLSMANDPPKLFFSPLRGHSAAGPISRTSQWSRSCPRDSPATRQMPVATKAINLVRPPPMGRTIHQKFEQSNVQCRIANKPPISFRGCVIVGYNALTQMRTMTNRKIAVRTESHPGRPQRALIRQSSPLAIEVFAEQLDRALILIALTPMRDC